MVVSDLQFPFPPRPFPSHQLCRVFRVSLSCFDAILLGSIFHPAAAWQYRGVKEKLLFRLYLTRFASYIHTFPNGTAAAAVIKNDEGW